MITLDDGIRIPKADSSAPSSTPEVIDSKAFPGRPDSVGEVLRFVRRAVVWYGLDVAETAEHGHGLVLVTRPATRWGVKSPHSGGTLTWFEITVNDGAVGTG